MSDNSIDKVSDKVIADKGQVLLHVARMSITQALIETSSANELLTQAATWQQDPCLQDTWLKDKAACFVTLMQHDQLRGCIGTLQAHRSLLDDVKANARAAAFNDTRFSPLTSHELDKTQVEVSLLSTMQAMNFSSEQEALAQLQPGIDGIVFEYGSYRSTFLPQVWQQLPNRKEFIVQLKHKAGLSADFWADQVKLSRYSVSKWKESDFVEEVPCA